MKKEFNKLRHLIKSFTNSGTVGCAIQVCQDGQKIYEEYEGYADLDTKQMIGPDTIYRMYSNTKVVTAVAALMLYEKGLFLLNDPINEYLPEFNNPLVYRYTDSNDIYTSPAKSLIKIKDLLTMSSGLAYPGEENETERQMSAAIKELGREGRKYDVREFSRTISKIPLIFDPGTSWNYSMSFEVLGALIEELSGMKLGDFLKKEIFEPLNMNDTFFRVPKDKKARLCSYYTNKEGGKPEKITDKDAFYEEDAVMEEGGAGLLSTISDYGRFAHVLATNDYKGFRLLSTNTIGLMASNHLSLKQLKDFSVGYLSGYGYGLGVRVMNDRPEGGANSSIGEFGWSGYAGTWVLIDPSKRLSAVYAHQMEPNCQEIYQPRLRNVIYGAID